MLTGGDRTHFLQQIRCLIQKNKHQNKQKKKKTAMAAAAAAASIRSVTHALPTIINNNKSSNLYSLLSFSAPNLFKSRPLILKSSALTLKPLSSHHLITRISSYSSSFAAYAETDEDNYEDDEEGEGEGEGEGEEEDEEEIELGKSRAVPPSSPPGEEAGRLYVGNLPYSITSSQLTEIFGQAGTVGTAEIVYDRVTDRSRGFAFVTLASNEDAKAAIRMFDGTQVGGRTVKVNFPEVPRGGEREVMGPRMRTNSRGYVDSPYKIYAGNLRWTVTSESLKDAFSDQPGVLGARIIYERDTGRSRGYGFITFASSEDAESAIQRMNGKELEGRPLRLNVASHRSSTSAAGL